MILQYYYIIQATTLLKTELVVEALNVKNEHIELMIGQRLKKNIWEDFLQEGSSV